MCFFSHKSCLQLKSQNLLHEDVTSSSMLVRVLSLCRGISVGSVPEATVGSRAACRLFESDKSGLGSLHCQWREGVMVSHLPVCHLSVASHLVGGGDLNLTGLCCWAGVSGPFLFGAPCGVMGSCTWALQKKGLPNSYTVVSPLTLSLLLSPFCFSCW